MVAYRENKWRHTRGQEHEKLGDADGDCGRRRTPQKRNKTTRAAPRVRFFIGVSQSSPTQSRKHQQPRNTHPLGKAWLNSVRNAMHRAYGTMMSSDKLQSATGHTPTSALQLLGSFFLSAFPLAMLIGMASSKMHT